MSNTLPVDFPASTSRSSSSTFTEVVASYRRAQTFLSTSNITTNAFPEYLDEEHTAGFEDEPSSEGETDSTEDNTATPRALDTIDPLWDDALQPFHASDNRLESNERAPLLKRTISWRNDTSVPELPERPRPTLRRVSTRSLESRYRYPGGNSTYKQTLFNSIAILLGIGILSEPLAFAYAGWGLGTFLIILYGYITCYTAKILAHIICTDPSLRTYADIGLKAFGRRSVVLTGLLFCLELFAVSVVLVTLFADSLHLVIPIFAANQYKILGLFIIIPTVFLPLSVLSYASLLGILSTFLIIVCITIDGLTKRETPGSLWQPAETEWGVSDSTKLGVAFGLFMAGFGGHGVIPSLARDMQDPSQFNEMIDWAFGIATAIYGVIGAAGYFMFGKNVNEEISKDILSTPGYPVFLNHLTVWSLVIAPLSKYALSARPLNLTIEIWLGIDNPTTPPTLSRPPSPTSRSAAVLATSPRTSSRPFLLVIERILVACLSVFVSILVPEFSTMMAFLGSFSAFVLCVIGPVSAKIAIERKCTLFDGSLLVISTIFMVWGTVAAFQ